MEPVQKSNFYSNVEYFMNKFEIKKTDLEKEAGVSQGYLSRFLQKEDPNNFPSVSFLDYCAKKFNTTMDDLVNLKFEDMSPTEEFIYSFLQKLINQTKEDELLWTVLNYNTIWQNISQTSDGNWDGYVKEKTKEMFIPPEEQDRDEIAFLPAKDLDRNMVLDGDVYSARIREDVRIFLQSIRSWNSYADAFDKSILLWMEQEGNPYQYEANTLQCVARGDDTVFTVLLPSLKKLKTVIEERQKHVQIEKGFKDVINWFMNPPKKEPEPNYDVDIDELPF